jgi:tetratricopeptide (TPR) repeat protein
MRIAPAFVLLLWFCTAATTQGQGTPKQDRDGKFQETFWENHREGREALEKGDLANAEAKFVLARKAAEELGDEKWQELAGTLYYLGTVKKDQNDLYAAEVLFRQALDIRIKHESPDDPELAGAQEDLATVYYISRQFEKAKPLLLQSMKIYEARLQDPSSTKDRAGYGRNLAMESLALSQIALASGRKRESEDRCKQALDYAQKWGRPADKEIVTSHCSASSANK